MSSTSKRRFRNTFPTITPRPPAHECSPTNRAPRDCRWNGSSEPEAGADDSREAKSLADAQGGGLLEHGVSQRDVAQAQSAMPEQDGLRFAFAARLAAGDDLTELRVQAAFGYLVQIDVRAQRAVGKSLAALSPVIDDHFVHDVGER